MTQHLWDSILELGLDDQTREEVIADGVRPAALPGPFGARAGLSLMRAGVFHVVSARCMSRAAWLLSGSLLEGGHCDRVLGADRDLRVKDGAVLVHAFACSAVRQNALVDRATASGRRLAAAGGRIAHPTLRAAIQDGDQFAVWTSVAELCRRFAPTCRSLVEALSSTAIATVLREELPRFLAPVSASLRSGLVMLHHGTPVAADVFKSTAALTEHAPGIVASYLVETMVRENALSTAGLEVLPAESTAARPALRRFAEAEQPGSHLQGWHTFFFARS